MKRFEHSTNARNHTKLKNMRCVLEEKEAGWGWQAVGIYWALLEKLYSANNYILPLNYQNIADELQCNPLILHSVINDFELFKVQDVEDNPYFYSPGILYYERHKRQIPVKYDPELYPLYAPYIDEWLYPAAGLFISEIVPKYPAKISNLRKATREFSKLQYKDQAYIHRTVSIYANFCKSTKTLPMNILKYLSDLNYAEDWDVKCFNVSQLISRKGDELPRFKPE